MSTRKKEIDVLRARIARLEQQHEKEQQQRQALEETRDSILKILGDADVSFESFVRFNYKMIRRIVTKIDRELVKVERPVVKSTTKKKVVKKRGRKPTKAKTTIKIPAGKYSNIPSDPETLFEVKEKGPRPKALKAYAEEIGLEMFLEQCRID
jgi:F0F1-type ATP synthase alpha subunit